MELKHYRQEGQNYIIKDEGQAGRKKRMLQLMAFVIAGMGIKIFRYGYEPVTLAVAGISIPIIVAIAYFKSLPIKVSLSATSRKIIQKDKQYSIELPVQFVTKRAYFNFRSIKEYRLYLNINKDNKHTKILLGQGEESLLKEIQQETGFILDTQFS